VVLFIFLIYLVSNARTRIREISLICISILSLFNIGEVNCLVSRSFLNYRNRLSSFMAEVKRDEYGYEIKDRDWFNGNLILIF